MTLTRTQFEEQLEHLRNMLLSMGSMADRAVADAMRALTDSDVQIAEYVIDRDDEIDEMDLAIESESMRLLALQQPIARDLRLVGTALKIITDLERIGDHAVDIAKVARKLARAGGTKDLADLPRMAATVRDMLKTALDAFIRHDLALVEVVVARDDEVDDLFHTVRDDLHAAMQQDPNLVVQASYLLFVAHYLERMADHAVNIAERVYFVETGQLSQLAKSHKTDS
ncbi:MAG: phosphate transport system protein [Fimbriimonadaceae bacterium]|jgi:phosphate transport system protein|nr:phosphate transport system protein [Fimbriimonadaceae bacterium]